MKLRALVFVLLAPSCAYAMGGEWLLTGLLEAVTVLLGALVAVVLGAVHFYRFCRQRRRLALAALGIGILAMLLSPLACHVWSGAFRCTASLQPMRAALFFVTALTWSSALLAMLIAIRGGDGHAPSRRA
jgi:hypothetical protein